jgi:tRNA (guanine-N7-)-methyltransferase
VNILDVGCGYGGLLYNMAPYLGPEDIALGMEIRDKVTNFVGDKIKTLRINSGHKQVSIIIYNCTLHSMEIFP